MRLALTLICGACVLATASVALRSAQLAWTVRCRRARVGLGRQRDRQRCDQAAAVPAEEASEGPHAQEAKDDRLASQPESEPMGLKWGKGPLPLLFAGALAVVAGCGQHAAPNIRSACGIELPPPRPRLAPGFAVPQGGRILVRRLAAGALLCRLLRPDGSRFAEAFRDRERRILLLAFFRRNGAPLTVVAPAYRVRAGDIGTHVKCASPSYATYSRAFWKTKLEWSIGAMPRKPARAAVVNALRAAFGEWTYNRNYCRLPDRSTFVSQYMGRTKRGYAYDQHNTLDWGSLARIPGCVGAAACTQTWYVAGRGATEADTRFNNRYRWITGRSTGGLDIQTTAAHEIGHALQFDHVMNVARRDWTNVMWPYEQEGDKGRLLGKGDALGNNADY